MGNARDKKTLTISQPHAAVMIYNYRDRLGSQKKTFDAQEVDQVILNTASLISVQTSKSKSDPMGRFQITLAPTKNWVTAVTPGSWCIILMSRDKIRYTDTKDPMAKADPRKFKMLGRVESVRVASNINQATGAKQTQYVVTGVDWGSIFNTYLYIDVLLRGQDNNPIGQAERLIYDDILLNQRDQLTSTNTMAAILRLWGRTSEAAAAIQSKASVLLQPEHAFEVPKEVMTYMGFKNGAGVPARKLADILRMRTGVLQGYDSYKEIPDGFTEIRPDSILGGNDFWQVLTEFSNTILNEMYSDIVWNNGEAELTLTKRIRPFCVHSQAHIFGDKTKVGDEGVVFPDPNAGDVADLMSQYRHIKRIGIPRNEILNFDAGTNWRDKYNFVEVGYDKSLEHGLLDSEVKLQSQFSDARSIRRDGFRPMMQYTKFIPRSNKGEPDVLGVLKYKYLIKEWFFDTHKMLNGSVTMTGQSEYIAIGDNIIFDAKVMFPGVNFNQEHKPNQNKSYITAHVESISHSISVGPNGARHYVTTIQFVRGILTDINSNPLSSELGGMLDQDTEILRPADEKNNHVMGTSTDNDPDQQRLRGR